MKFIYNKTLFKKNINKKKFIATIPNILTIFRLFLTFPLIIFLEINKPNIVFALIILGGLTDYFDSE